MDSVGVVAVIAVLVVGVGIGLWRRRTDGRFVDVGSPSPQPARSEPAAARLPQAEGPAVDDTLRDDERLDAGLLTRLGIGPAEATLLQFSSAFCAPCRAVRRVSEEVAGMVAGVQHVEVDAESHLEEVRALNIWRTPTLLVLDAGGRVTKRASGVPTKPQLIAALGEVLPAREIAPDRQ
jgi:thiol-disulfide isomerase/thioredoxin